MYAQVDISSPVMWISQVRGATKIRLTPRQPCDSNCSTLYAMLHEGETGWYCWICAQGETRRYLVLKDMGYSMKPESATQANSAFHPSTVAK